MSYVYTRKPIARIKKWVCFELMHYEEGIDATVKIPVKTKSGKTKLPYSQGGETKYVDADELIDLIQPFRNN